MDFMHNLMHSCTMLVQWIGKRPILLVKVARRRESTSGSSPDAPAALPAVAKRVLNEWTSTIVAANNDRRARQRAAERRIDISGASGAATAGRSASPRSVDYARMSDSDILNL